MAVEFKKLSAEWKVTQGKISNAWGKMDSASQTEMNTRTWLEGAREDIIEKILKSKEDGKADGKTLNDFLKVAEVKKAWTEIQSMLKTAERGHDEYQAQFPVMKALHAEASKILANANAEIAERQKNKILKSKSLPDIIKLAGEINTALKKTSPKHMRSVTDFVKEKQIPFTLEKRIVTWIDADIKSQINSIKANADDDAALRSLNVRHLAVVNNKVAGLSKEFTALCAAAAKAAKTSADKVKTAALAKAATIAAQCQKIYNDYAKVIKDHGDEVKAHKDGPKMMAGASKIMQATKQVVDQFTKVKKALG